MGGGGGGWGGGGGRGWMGKELMEGLMGQGVGDGGRRDYKHSLSIEIKLELKNI